MGTLIFFACIALAVGALLGLDWFMAGRAGGRRSLRSGRDAAADNANVGYAAVEINATQLGQSGQGGAGL